MWIARKSYRCYIGEVQKTEASYYGHAWQSYSKRVCDWDRSDWNCYFIASEKAKKGNLKHWRCNTFWNQQRRRIASVSPTIRGEKRVEARLRSLLDIISHKAEKTSKWIEKRRKHSKKQTCLSQINSNVVRSNAAPMFEQNSPFWHSNHVPTSNPTMGLK